MAPTTSKTPAHFFTPISRPKVDAKKSVLQALTAARPCTKGPSGITKAHIRVPKRGLTGRAQPAATTTAALEEAALPTPEATPQAQTPKRGPAKRIDRPCSRPGPQSTWRPLIAAPPDSDSEDEDQDDEKPITAPEALEAGSLSRARPKKAPKTPFQKWRQQRKRDAARSRLPRKEKKGPNGNSNIRCTVSGGRVHTFIV